MKKPFQSFAAFAILGVAIYFTYFLISPQPSLPANIPASNFSAERAYQDLEIIAQEPHPMGISPAHAKVRDHLLEEIRLLGLEPEIQKTIGVRVVNSGWVIAGAVENILVRLPGTDPDGAILLSSHYDSTPGGPGGGDSGSGIVTILEVLRALKAKPILRQDVIFLFSDGEEPGTIGAHAFVAQHPWLADVRFVINIDQITEGPAMLMHSSQSNGNLILAMAHSSFSTQPAFISFPFDLFPGGDTDLLPFELAGIPGAEIDAGGVYPEKHTILDRPTVVDPNSLQQAGTQIHALVQKLADQPELKIDQPDQTFFPMLGMLVHYPSNLAWLFSICATGCFLGTFVYGFHKRILSWKGIGWGALSLIIFLLINVLISNLLRQGILAVHPEYQYISFSGYRQKLSDDYLYAFGFLVITLAITSSSIAVVRKKISKMDLAAGVFLIWLPLTIALTILFPATSYLGTWVILFSSLSLLSSFAAKSNKNADQITGLAFLLNAILVSFLMVPLVYIAILSGPISPGTPIFSLMIIAASLWLGGMVPILDWITTPKRWFLPSAAFLIALAFLLSGHILAGKNSPPPLVNPIGYWLDTHKREAYWIAYSEELDGRQTKLLVSPIRRSYTDLFSEAPQQIVQTSIAPILSQDGPQLEILSDRWVDNKRILKASITTSMNDRVYIIIPKEYPIIAFTLPHNERTELPVIENNEWVLRFDGTPVDGFEISLELPDKSPIKIMLIEEKTGLPTFTGLSTQPEPGTMKSPGEFYQIIPTDFTAINRNFTINSLDQ